MEIAVLNSKGVETGKVDLPEAVFGIEPNDHAIYLDVKAYLAAQRQGTHKAKERAEIVGSTRKLKKQKGTGTARSGSIKSPVFRGGGRIFGPRPRNYRQTLNRKLKQLARRSALAYKAKESNVTVLETLSFEAPQTKAYKEVLSNLQFSDVKTLLVLGEQNDNVYKSARNLPKANVVVVDSLNTYEVLHADKLIIAQDAVEKFSNL
ncbi:50S ribosomal protein L4 [Flammeovirga yaeyamensis]|uniref:Large ribosomal subunit protein uL4 n=1 Tax=Flammeovirga yaeyamensis TaxID=367791 RepID=A0AAX1N278_9BACT|nr:MULTISPECIES: 50S ribosomal protein L4 [Flammeovirga]ANQ51050.1 50S ribosomal protein L4 [Flammeovirga sp. MY04]MBB3698076.1 large subunit ribosomal protein L4 [Flammeovirga yaeyamensis]NMF34565.1 50S ribosomal protein L4 [Flammeovirga yaeyamensis]QWG01542.1 50S ribosomal protein L4 [Flammeovirga yaeyamensis]